MFTSGIMYFLSFLGIKRDFRYNISFIKTEGNIITEGNISPNTPRSGSINDIPLLANEVQRFNVETCI